MMLCFILFVGLAIGFAQASHFRAGFISWERTGVDGEVKFTVTSAWRATQVDPINLRFGDGSQAGSFGTPIFLGTDGNGQQYQVQEYTFTHTYAGAGPYLAFFDNCCRISTLQNAADNNFHVSTEVDLSANVDSPVGSVPAIIQLPITQSGQKAQYQLAVADPQGLPLTCRLATSAESGIASVPTVGGQSVSVTPDCVLQWDTSAGTVGQQYAVQIIVEQSGNDVYVPLDFIIELQDATLMPTCQTSVTGPQTIYLGQTLSITVTGTSQRTGVNSLTISALNLQAGATLTPTSGSTGNVPFEVLFEFTPTSVDQAAATVIVFTDPYFAQASCAISYQVLEGVDCDTAIEFLTCELNGTSKSFGISANIDISPVTFEWMTNCTSGVFSEISGVETTLTVTSEGPCEVTLNVSSTNQICTRVLECLNCDEIQHTRTAEVCSPDSESVCEAKKSQNFRSFNNNQVLGTVSDPDGPIIQASTTNQLPGGVSLNPITGELYVSNKSAIVAGTYSITVATIDSTGGRSSCTINLTFIDCESGTSCSQGKGKAQKVHICHKTSSATNPIVQLCLPLEAVPAHITNHGDFWPGSFDGSTYYTCGCAGQ